VLFKLGRPHVLNLDEYFPFNKKKEVLLFQKPFDKDLWPMVLEKGLAKLHGSYMAINTLNLEELLEAIFGAPTRRS